RRHGGKADRAGEAQQGVIDVVGARPGLQRTPGMAVHGALGAARGGGGELNEMTGAGVQRAKRLDGFTQPAERLDEGWVAAGELVVVIGLVHGDGLLCFDRGIYASPIAITTLLMSLIVTGFTRWKSKPASRV